RETCSSLRAEGNRPGSTNSCSEVSTKSMLSLQPGAGGQPVDPKSNQRFCCLGGREEAEPTYASRQTVSTSDGGIVKKRAGAHSVSTGPRLAPGQRTAPAANQSPRLGESAGYPENQPQAAGSAPCDNLRVSAGTIRFGATLAKFSCAS